MKIVGSSKVRLDNKEALTDSPLACEDVLKYVAFVLAGSHWNDNPLTEWDRRPSVLDEVLTEWI